MTYLHIPVKNIIIFTLCMIPANVFIYYFNGPLLEFIVVDVLVPLFFILYPEHIIDSEKPNKKDQWID